MPIVEIAVAGVSVKKNWYAGGIRHTFQIVRDLGPTGLISITNTGLWRDGKALAQILRNQASSTPLAHRPL